MSEEKELLHGKLAGIFYHPSLVLTNRRLIIGNGARERSIDLTEILEVYAKQERLQSNLVIHLKDGKTEELTISPEKSVSALTYLSGSIDAQESEMRAGSKATTDRWANLINRCLSNTEKTETEIPTILSKESQVQPVAQPASQPVSQDNLKNDQMTPLLRALLQAQHKRDRVISLQKLEDQLETNLITKEDYEKRKRDILAEV